MNEAPTTHRGVVRVGLVLSLDFALLDQRPQCPPDAVPEPPVPLLGRSEVQRTLQEHFQSEKVGADAGGSSFRKNIEDRFSQPTAMTVKVVGPDRWDGLRTQGGVVDLESSVERGQVGSQPFSPALSFSAYALDVGEFVGRSSSRLGEPFQS